MKIHQISVNHQEKDEMDTLSGTDSIFSFYTYGQISSDEEFDFSNDSHDNNNDDTDKDPDYLPESNTVPIIQNINLAEVINNNKNTYF